MSQDPNNIGLLPPPPLLPTQPLPMPSVSQYSTQTHYPPPLPPPPLQPMYGVQYQASNMPASVPGYLNPYQQQVQGGIPTQPHFNATPAAAALNPVNQAQAIYAAASQMMIGNMMMDHMSTNKRDRRKRRSGSPKRRMRSRSESPQRSKRVRDNKRRRNRSPNHKRSYSNKSPQKRVEKKIEGTKKEEKVEEKKAEEENLYQPPTPEENVVAADSEPENDMPDGNKTPDYKADEDGAPKTPEYDARTGSAVTPPSSTSNNTALTSSRDVTSSNSVTYDSLTSSSTMKTVASVKPTPALPKMISLKKIRDTDDLSSPVPDVGVKSLADILREQALKSMKRKPTPERESESERKTRDVTPEPDNIRTRAESPSLDRSTTETSKLSRPFDNIDKNMFKPETSIDSEEDFYSDDEFDPKKYDRNSEDDLLASPDRKNDLTGITMNFTVTPDVSKKAKKQAKLEKKKLKKLKKEQKKLKRLAKKQNQALSAESSSKETSANSSDKVAPDWQKRLISSHLGGDKTPNTTSPNSTPPSTPDHEEAEFLKTPEKCDQIFFESEPTPTTEEPKPKKKTKRKVVVINKDPAVSTSQMEIPESKPEVDLSSISTTKPLGNLFGATIRSLVPPKAEQTRSLVPPKAEQINTVSTTATKQTKGFNPFAPSTISQPTKPISAPTNLSTATSVPAPISLAAPASSTTSLASAVPTLSNTTSIRSLNNPFAKPDTTRKIPPEPKLVKRLGGVKTIRIKKSVPITAPVPEQKVVPVKTVEKPPLKRPISPIDEDLDDIDKELDLLNAALDVPPTSFKSAAKPKTENLEDDDDLFADIEEFLNEERSKL